MPLEEIKRKREEMKKIELNKLEDYLTTAGAHSNPKTLKVVEAFKGEKCWGLRAVTFPVTFILEWKKYFNLDEVGKAEYNTTLTSLLEQGHLEGKVTDITTGRQ